MGTTMYSPTAGDVTLARPGKALASVSAFDSHIGGVAVRPAVTPKELGGYNTLEPNVYR